MSTIPVISQFHDDIRQHVRNELLSPLKSRLIEIESSGKRNIALPDGWHHAFICCKITFGSLGYLHAARTIYKGSWKY